MVAGVSHQHCDRNVEKVPYNIHRLSILWTKYSTHVAYDPSLSFLRHIAIAGLILSFLDSFLTPEENLREMLGVRQQTKRCRDSREDEEVNGYVA